MNVRPVTPAALVDAVLDRIIARGVPGWLRVGVDGAPPTEPDRLAETVAQRLRDRGRPALHVRAGDFLRQASLRLEYGRTNPDAFYEDWLDLSALRREVLDPLGTSGTGRVLPSLRDPATDRPTRATRVDLPAGGVLLLSGALLLGAGLSFELSVHLRMSPAALARRTPPELAWTLPAYARYGDEVAPETFADLVVRIDDPRHPAIA